MLLKTIMFNEWSINLSLMAVSGRQSSNYAWHGYYQNYIIHLYYLFKITVNITDGPRTFAFEVKFYPSDPTVLHEDITRYVRARRY